MRPLHGTTYILKLVALVAVVFGVIVVIANFVGGIYVALASAIVTLLFVLLFGRIKARSESRRTEREWVALIGETESSFKSTRAQFDMIPGPGRKNKLRTRDGQYMH